MDYYIVKTRKSGSTEREITHYEQTTNRSSSTGNVVSKASFRNMVDISQDRFYSHNVRLGSFVECEWYRYGENGEPFLKSDPNGTKKDNLLELPDC